MARERVLPGRCPRHPDHWSNDCDPCEHEAGKRELRVEGDEWQVDQDRYESWLDRIGGSA